MSVGSWDTVSSDVSEIPSATESKWQGRKNTSSGTMWKTAMVQMRDVGPGVKQSNGDGEL